MKLTEKTVDNYLDEIYAYAEVDDAFELRKLSNELVEKTITSDDKSIFELSVISFTLSNILTKEHTYENKKWKDFKKNLLAVLKKDREKPDTLREIAKIVSDVLDVIYNYDKKTSNFINSDIKKARIKQGSRLYALGLSLSKAAEIAKIGKRELLDYVGITKIHDRPFTQTKNLKKRYETARRVLK